jgi:hypothetical protein
MVLMLLAEPRDGRTRRVHHTGNDQAVNGFYPGRDSQTRRRALYS